jgi:hypothetical protein
MVALFSLAWMFSACAGLGTSYQVLPSGPGQDVSLDSIVSNMQDYDTYYSGPVFNPSAVLFIPQQREMEVRPAANGPAMGWQEVGNREQLADLLKRLRELRDPQIKLWALTPPDKGRNGGILGYVYTAGNVQVRKDSESGSYTVFAVPERFNPRYYDATDSYVPRDH